MNSKDLKTIIAKHLAEKRINECKLPITFDKYTYDHYTYVNTSYYFDGGFCLTAYKPNYSELVPGTTTRYIFHSAIKIEDAIKEVWQLLTSDEKTIIMTDILGTKIIC